MKITPNGMPHYQMHAHEAVYEFMERFGAQFTVGNPFSDVKKIESIANNAVANRQQLYSYKLSGLGGKGSKHGRANELYINEDLVRQL